MSMKQAFSPICGNIGCTKDGHLTFAGQDVTVLAARYGTPLYLMDEDRVRANCRMYRSAMAEAFGEKSRPLYAGKACSFKAMYRIMAEENMDIDVVSPGEILCAKEAGYDLSQAYFHGNGKTDADIRYAMEQGVGCFILDNREELLAVSRIAGEMSRTQNVMFRLTPGVDPHTYAAVATGIADSKFGIPIDRACSLSFCREILQTPHVKLLGIHCHVGSMVFGEDIYQRTAQIMLDFMADVRRELGYTLQILDLGGGYGVRYVDSDPIIDIPARIRELGVYIRRCCGELGLELPEIHLEPGRSIAADGGMTLYTVQNRKTIPAVRDYITVDGGMGDNPRYALYGSRYTCYNASRMTEEADLTCTLAGRCCESGDIIQPDILLPSATCRGDIAAVCTTGAYNYTMASAYNRFGRPAVVMLSGGQSRLAVLRQTPEELLRGEL